jgi:hypothetical protein
MNGSGGRAEARPGGGGKNRGRDGQASVHGGRGEQRSGSQNGGRSDRNNRGDYNGRNDRNDQNVRNNRDVRGERNVRGDHNGRDDYNSRNERGSRHGNDYSDARRGEGENGKKSPAHNRKPVSILQKLGIVSSRDKKGRDFYDRPKWTPAKKPDEPVPQIICSLCGQPITDIASAISDRESDEVFHFDCIAAKLKERETLGEGDSLTYIGGGRFGIVHHVSQKKFTIKKIIEWDQREERVSWRKLVADHYSST